ncbi:polysaccharide biosynthesis tyrosine autokinase [Leptolyngbya sp. FACHB-1515]
MLQRYLVALDRHKWAAIAGFLVVMSLSGVAAMQPQPPSEFVAAGTLAYSAPPVTLSQTGTALQQQGQSLTAEFLLSDAVVNAVAQSLRLDPIAIRERAEVIVNPGADDRDRQEREAAGYRVLVRYRHPDATLAQEAANRLMEAIVEQSRQFNAQQLSRIADNLQQLRSQVGQELQQAERALEQYVRQQAPAVQAAQEGDVLGAITGGEAQQRQIQLAIAGIDAQIRSLQARLGLTPDQAYASSALSADPIIANLRAQIYQTESQLQILAPDLRPEHPTMIQLRNQQQAYEQLLQQRVTEVIGGNQQAAPLPNSNQIRQDSSLDPARQQLANTLVNLQTQRDTLAQQLTTLQQAEGQLRQQYASLPNRQLQQARLQQNVALKQNSYNQIEARLADVTLAEKETVGSLVVLQPVQTELAAADNPSSAAILLVGGFVGLLVGGGLVLLLDSLDATFHTLQDLQTALRQQEIPVLGLLPLLPDRGALPERTRTRADLPIAPLDSPYLEPFDRFRSNLRRSTGSKFPKLVILTSTIAQEGKTVTAYNLAIASAHAGKRTLLIEADLRSPSQAAVLKVTPDPIGAIDPLRYYSQPNDCIRMVPDIENLYLLPSPSVQRQASAILESSEMRRLLDEARGRFDLVVLDTPDLSRYNDALLIEPYVDGLVLVTRPNYTEEPLLNEAIEQFIESEEIQFLGAVINAAEMPMQPTFTGFDLQSMANDREEMSTSG